MKSAAFRVAKGHGWTLATGCQTVAGGQQVKHAGGPVCAAPGVSPGTEPDLRRSAHRAGLPATEREARADMWTWVHMGQPPIAKQLRLARKLLDCRLKSSTFNLTYGSGSTPRTWNGWRGKARLSESAPLSPGGRLTLDGILIAPPPGDLAPFFPSHRCRYTIHLLQSVRRFDVLDLVPWVTSQGR